MENFLSIITAYYGLDWLALLFGISGSYLISSQNRYGFLLACIGCLCGFFVATISSQYGFVLYNLMLLFIMLRGYVNLTRFQSRRGAPAE
jgi:hypothetical protein